ncbi:hypothetical protein [Corynebacterium guangdongense]|uniref:Uncharacterized protein n=1 Tax=Corynebacterium guangdongense TaxID=1783348 RepID=A0ABU1ZW20_9CORY|nr:hypothetical protein [Corynebacterium guangdongense]MDR7328955.1 hypothetical protein [Corynebacterium guangdongense]WJZ17528.1 hypothetical protein CGUA_04710 [Corynebacterium guangdongense]
MATMDEVRAARMSAARAHGQLMGNSSACTMSKSGQSFPAGKFWEGKTAALGELVRSGAADVSAEAARLHRDWCERVVPGEEREAEAYRNGGLEALAEFAG